MRQDAENGDYSVRVTCEATTLKINEICFEGNHVHARKTAQERLTASEQEQYGAETESVTGSLQWVVRIARVESQTAVEQTTADEKTSNGGSSCLCKQGPPIPQEVRQLLLWARSDVSDGNHQLAPGRFCDCQAASVTRHTPTNTASERESRTEVREDVGMTILATRSLVDQAECGFHLIACTSNTLKRVCRSTLTTETYHMELAVEAADQLRAAIADMFEPLSRKQWEIEATRAIQLIWVTDCDSCRSALVRPTMGKPTDKRLGITIASLRQAIWRRRGETIGAPMVTETLPSSSDATDVCRWVDTDCMLADALTKQMSPEKLVAAIDTNTWSLEQPIERKVRKRDKQRQRAAGRDQQKEKKEQQVQRQLNETHAEVMGSSDPESQDDDSPGALG